MIKTEVDTQFTNIKSMVFQMSSDQELIDQINSYTKYDYYNIINKLKKHKNFNKNIYELILYKRDTNKILTTDCEYTIPEFINTYYRYSDWTEKQFTYFINNIDKTSIRSPEHITSYDSTRKKIITFGYPFSVFRKDFSSTLLVLIEDRNLHGIFDKHQYLDQEDLLIIDQNNMVLSSTNKLITSLDVDLLSKKLIEKSSFVYSLGPEHYLVNATRSTSTNLTFISLCPTSIYMEKVNHVQLTLLYALGIVVILGSIVIILYMRKNSTPIFNIYKLLSTSNQSTHYLKDIKDAIHTLSIENDTLTATLKENQPAINSYYLNRLLLGYYNDMDAFTEASGSASIVFNAPELFILLIAIDYPSDVTRHTRLKIRSIVETYMLEKNSIYGVNTLNDAYVYIGSGNPRDSLWDSHLTSLKTYIHQTFNCDCTMGVGNAYIELDQLEHSLIEAQISVEYQFIHGTNKIIYYSDISNELAHANWYPIKQYEALHNVIHFKNNEKIDYHIDRLIDYIKESHQPISVMRYMSYELIHIIIKQMYELGIYDTIREEYAIDITTLIGCKNIDDLATMLKNICHHICQYMNQATRDIHHTMKEDLLIYLEENCLSCDFSIKLLAEKFNMSQSSLSQHFKHYTGKTISTYVDNLRIEKSKQLLKTTNLPIKDILPQIGYYDNSSFTRKFKQMTGITPGKYRTLYKI